MADLYCVGIDIGTSQVKVAITESLLVTKGKSLPRVLGVGFSESKGMRHGYIINIPEVARSIRIAVDQAEKAAGVSVRSAFVAVGGMGLSGFTSVGSSMITRGDSEVTDLDISNATKNAEAELPKNFTLNRKLIHTIPVQYRIDGNPVLGNPRGIKGAKIEVKVLFLSCLEHHINDTIQAVQEAGIEVEDVIASPLAASMVTLTKAQKIQGCVLANIGAETITIAVFENDVPISVEVFPVGSTNITNDIALGLRIPLEEAEAVKTGNARSDVSYSKKKLEEIIDARLSDIFELIEAHLKKIGKSGLLPAGIVITGGGSGLQRLADSAKVTLRLPAKIATFHMSGNFKTPIKDATWAVAYGLCILSGLEVKDPKNSLKNWFQEANTKITGWFRQFLP